MKHLPLKLAAGIIVVFGLLLLGFALWIPLKTRYYLHLLHSKNISNKLAAVEGLIAMGEDGKKILVKKIGSEVDYDDFVRVFQEAQYYNIDLGDYLILDDTDNYVKLASFLIELGANINERGEEHGRTPLHDAAALNQINIVRLLLKHGADFNVMNNYNETPLDTAIESGHTKIASILFNAGAEFDSSKINDYLLGAIWDHNNFQLVELLIKHGADVNYKEENGDTPLGNALERDINIARILLEHGADPDIGGQDSPLHTAVSSDNPIKLVKLLLEYGANVNIRNINGETPVFYAVYWSKSIEVVKLLLENGADVNIKDEEGKTPLFNALCSSHPIEVAKLLIKNGTNVNIISGNGETVLDYADKDKIKAFLRSHGAKTAKELKSEAKKIR